MLNYSQINTIYDTIFCPRDEKLPFKNIKNDCLTEEIMKKRGNVKVVGQSEAAVAPYL